MGFAGLMDALQAVLVLVPFLTVATAHKEEKREGSLSLFCSMEELVERNVI